MHGAVGAHPREGAIDLRDGDGATPGDADHVAAAGFDARRDGTEDAAAAGDELPDRIRVDERCVTRARLDELEQPIVRGGEDRFHARGDLARDRLGSVAAAHGAGDLARGDRASVVSRGRPRRSTTA